MTDNGTAPFRVVIGNGLLGLLRNRLLRSRLLSGPGLLGCWGLGRLFAHLLAQLVVGSLYLLYLSLQAYYLLVLHLYLIALVAYCGEQRLLTRLMKSPMTFM